MMRVRDSLAAARRQLAAVSDAPALEAARLHAAALSLAEDSWLYAHSEAPLPAPAARRLGAWLERRRAGEPLAYILGEWEFYGRPFFVSPDVLVPRPATEQLIDRALNAITQLADRRQRPLRVADVGTGSGCIAVTLLCETPQMGTAPANISIVASDISPAALRLARKNAQRHGVLERIEFVEGDMLAPLTGRDIDLVVSNPPYVPTAEIDQAAAMAETRGLLFEPRVALDGGPDGRQYVDRLAASGIPAVIESVGGVIETYALPQASG